MSTAGQPTATWRDEVNRRLAEHRNRKNGTPQPSEQVQAAEPGSSLAAQAAARVAARYSKAKSYSQMQAEEARLAVRHAEIATQVALEAQASASTVLAELHAATVEAPPAEVIPFAAPAENPAWDWAADKLHTESRAEAQQAAVIEEPMDAVQIAPEPAYEPIQTGPVTDCTDSAGQLRYIRWEPDMPMRATQQRPSADPFDLAPEDWWTPAESAEADQHGPVEVDARTIQANLIRFPREIIATRKMRPRLAEPSIAASQQPGAQLSIFEVDPGTVEIEPPAAESISVPADWAYADSLPAETDDRMVAAPAPSAAVHAPAELPQWSAPDWSSIRLGVLAAQTEAAPVQTVKPKALAPLHSRLMAGIVDASLIGALASFLWLSVALGSGHMLAPRGAGVLGVVLIALCGLAWHGFFGMLSLRTPGMRYAGLSLSTFDNRIPEPDQLRRRLVAMALSMLPLGLGMVWSVFDEDHLSWHDRFSQTYLRKA